MTKRSFDLAIINANELLTIKGASQEPKVKEEMEELGVIENGAILIKNKEIAAVGKTEDFSAEIDGAEKVIDAKNKVVMPGFIDCHTHLLFGGSREKEFAEKIRGASYLEILKKGGGILSTVEQTRRELWQHPEIFVNKMLSRLRQILEAGTTTAEVKTGYGLDIETEIYMLNWIKMLKTMQSIDLIPCFLGAHAIPREYIGKRKEYIELVIKMLPTVKDLAEYCDAFCEREAFSIGETRKILEKAKEFGMKLKLHTNEFNDIGGAELGLELGAVSLDHLDYVSDNGLKEIAKHKVIGVLLPGVPFHLMSAHYAPARKMIKMGVPIAIASDFNPGSCPTFSMQMIIALACRMMKMSPAQALNAATINAAHAINRAKEIGSLETGKKADVIILDIPNHQQLPYWFGSNLVETVIKNGKIVI